MNHIFDQLKQLFDVSKARGKLTYILLSVIYLMGLFDYSLLHFNTSDTIPKPQPINTEAIKKLGTFAVRLRTGMFIKKFIVFDVVNNRFIVDSVVWFEYNPDEIMPETIAKFSFDNGKILSMSPPDIKIIDSQVFTKYNVIFELTSDLQFHKFPFEDHRLPIVMTNNFVTPEEMYFMVDGSSFQLLGNFLSANWRVVDLNVDSGFERISLDKENESKKVEAPKAMFVINFGKASIKQTMIIFIPLFATTIFSLVSFAMKLSNTVGRFTLAVSAVTALLGYRFVLEQMMPKVGYFTTTDAIYIFLLVFSFICFLFQLMITRQAEHSKDTPKNPASLTARLNKVNNGFFIAMLLTFLLVMSFIMLR